MKKLALLILTISTTVYADEMITDNTSITDNSYIQQQQQLVENSGMLENAQNQSANEDSLIDQFDQLQELTGTNYDSSNTSSDDCAIWLCLPASFPSPYCNNAKSAFKHRIKHHKSPLPSFRSCVSNATDQLLGNNSNSSNDDWYYKNGIAAYVPAHKERDQCLKYTIVYGSTGGLKQCQEWSYKDIPAAHIVGTPCLHGEYGTTTPKGCTRTDSWVEVYNEGTKQGSTYYY